MPASQQHNEMSRDQVASLSTQELPLKLLDNAAVSCQDSRLDVNTSLSILIDVPQAHINSTGQKSQVNCKQLSILTGAVDEVQENEKCSLNSNKNLNSQKYLSSRPPNEKVLNQNSVTNQSSGFSTYELDNSLSINDGKESIELMISSLTSTGNTDELATIRKNNNHVHKNKEVGNVQETDTTFFNSSNSKENIQREISPGAIVNSSADFKSLKEPTRNSSKTFLNLQSTPKIETTIQRQENFHDISKIEPTPVRKKCAPISNPSVTSMASNNTKINNQKENIKPTIILNDKTINNYNSNPTVYIKKGTMPSSQRENSKSINNKSLLSNSCIHTVNTNSANHSPMRNQQAPFGSRSKPLLTGI